MKYLASFVFLLLSTGLSAQITTINVPFPGDFKPYGLETTINTPSSVTISWNEIEGASFYQVKGRPVGTTPFASVVTSNTFKNIGGLVPGQSYEWKVQAACTSPPTIAGATGFSSLSPFTLPSMRELLSQSLNLERIYPNPATEESNLSISLLEPSQVNILLFDVSGRVVFEDRLYLDQGQHNVVLDLKKFDSGYYLLSVNRENHPIIILK